SVKAKGEARGHQAHRPSCTTPRDPGIVPGPPDDRAYASHRGANACTMTRVERADESRLRRALRAAQDGDEESFRLLYREVQPRLIRFAGALVGADAEDVTSEAWLQ